MMKVTKVRGPKAKGGALVTCAFADRLAGAIEVLERVWKGARLHSAAPKGPLARALEDYDQFVPAAPE